MQELDTSQKKAGLEEKKRSKELERQEKYRK